MIYELEKVQKETFWMGVALGVLTTLLVILSFDKLLDTQVSSVDMPKDVIAAYNMGIKDALKTNPASAELEMACLELWGKK